MNYSGREVIEMIPKGQEAASKMSMLGCGIQLLVGLVISQMFLWALVFLALLT